MKKTTSPKKKVSSASCFPWCWSEERTDFVFLRMCLCFCLVRCFLIVWCCVIFELGFIAVVFFVPERGRGLDRLCESCKTVLGTFKQFKSGFCSLWQKSGWHFWKLFAWTICETKFSKKEKPNPLAPERVIRRGWFHVLMFLGFLFSDVFYVCVSDILMCLFVSDLLRPVLFPKLSFLIWCFRCCCFILERGSGGLGRIQIFYISQICENLSVIREGKCVGEGWRKWEEEEGVVVLCFLMCLRFSFLVFLCLTDFDVCWIGGGWGWRRVWWGGVWCGVFVCGKGRRRGDGTERGRRSGLLNVLHLRNMDHVHFREKRCPDFRKTYNVFFSETHKQKKKAAEPPSIPARGQKGSVFVLDVFRCFWFVMCLVCLMFFVICSVVDVVDIFLFLLFLI